MVVEMHMHERTAMDGDPPGGVRYTECACQQRDCWLKQFSGEIDIEDKNTVPKELDDTERN